MGKLALASLAMMGVGLATGLVVVPAVVMVLPKNETAVKVGGVVIGFAGTMAGLYAVKRWGLL